MHIAAFIISLAAGLFSFLQGGCGTVLGAIWYGIERGGIHEDKFVSVGAAGFLVAIAAILGITGGAFALARKRASFAMLIISSCLCWLVFLI